MKKYKRKVPRTFCTKCYNNEHYFVRCTNTTVMMRCSKCDAYIKWATIEEYKDKPIRNDISVKLF